MHATLPLLRASDFPPLRRRALETLQVNLGYRCNQSCLHCHVNAGPSRKEEMSSQTADQVIAFLDASPSVRRLDLTGGAPELNANFRRLVAAARERGLAVTDRCNLTILEAPGHEDLAQFLARHEVEIVASLPCYLEENVDRQRGDGVFEASLRALRRLNALGYGAGELKLDLVFNPPGATLPPPQAALQADYKRQLWERFGVCFDRLYTLANMPIQRFGSTLVSKGEFNAYLRLLRQAHQAENLDRVMCLSLVSVDWQGYLYDCDFNQQLRLPLGVGPRLHIAQASAAALAGRPVQVAEHCYGCTAGQGSSCGGALGDAPPAAPTCARAP